MDLPKVEGTQIRGTIYHLNLRIKPEIQDFYDGKSHLRGSLRTSDPEVAREEVRRYKAELARREQEYARQAEVDDLVAQLSPEKRAAYDAAGGLEGLLEGFERRSVGTASIPSYLAPADDAGGTDPATPPLGALDTGMTDDTWPVGETALTVAEDTGYDYDEPVFTLADLFNEYAPQLDADSAEALGHVVRLFDEFHGEIAFDELTLADLDEFAVASHGLPADMLAKLADGTYVRDLPFAELVAWTVHADARPISETTRFQYVALLKELMAFGVPAYRRGDPWSDYRLQIIRREAGEEPQKRAGGRFSPSEWTLSGAVMRLLELTILLFIIAVLYLLWEARS